MPAYVDRVVICDAFSEPDQHHQILTGGHTRVVADRRPSVTLKADKSELKGGLAGANAKSAAAPPLFDEPLFDAENNVQINLFRSEVREWREAGYPEVARVTRRLLEWWFERPEERHAEMTQFFFCQREAIETLVYLYEVKRRFQMPGTDLLRYALKLATGTGKTVVMGLVVTWSSLHKTKVSGSTLSNNFLVLVPNLTVRSRVSGDPRGDGLVPTGPEDLYHVMDMVPPEYREAFAPRVKVMNWQSIPLEGSREDWVPEKQLTGANRFVSYSVMKAMERRSQRDPRAPIRKLLKGWRDVVVINDEAHHAYGEKRSADDDPAYIKWSKVISAVSEVATLSVVVDLSATPWYGSGSPKPEGQLFEWVVSDFSVYDAFESGLVKIVRLPEPDGAGNIYIDLWDRVKDAKTSEEFLSSARGAIESIHASWREDFQDWEAKFEEFRDAQPVLLVVASDAKKAGWLFDHLTSDPSFPLLHNQDPDDRSSWTTVQIDSKVFDADKGKEAIIREMVNTVGKKRAAGEHVRCIVSVNMLSEGWDVKSVSHIIGFRAFGSPLLTEQIIGRGLRRTDYSVLYEPLDDRGPGSDETVDAFGIPFVGFPVQKTKKRPRTGKPGETPVPIEPEAKKSKYRVQIPNVRSWAVGMTKPLSQVIDVKTLPPVVIDPKKTPPIFKVKPVVGEGAEREISLEKYRDESPITAIQMRLAAELMRRTTAEDAPIPGTGPTFEELLEVVQAYVERQVTALPGGDVRDLWIPHYRQQALDAMETAIKSCGSPGINPVPMSDDPPVLDTSAMRQFRWIGPRANGKKCHLGKIACDSDLEVAFADFLDDAKDVRRYIKNERFGYSVTYYEGGRPRQYYPDFIVAMDAADGGEQWIVAETKGEVWPNTDLKRLAAEKWCEMMTAAKQGEWSYLFVQQRAFEKAFKHGVTTLTGLIAALRVPVPVTPTGPPAVPGLRLVLGDDEAPKGDRFNTLLPVYSLEAAAGYFGEGQHVELDGWMEVDGHLDDRMFVAKVVGHSMEPRIGDGSWCVFRAKPTGTRQNKILMVQHQGPADPDTGGSFTVKKYNSTKRINDDGELEGWTVTLSPLNRDFVPIELTPEFEHDVQVVAEFVSVLEGADGN